jgi:DNA-binding transcriptional LysR family regulator
MPRRYGRWVELRQAEAFVAVADHGGFAAAADALGTVQPAVSRLIARLERTNGIVLFERSPRRVTITAAGERLLPAARGLLAAHGRLIAEQEALREGRIGLLRVGTTGGMTTQATAIAADFARSNPGIELRFSAAHTPEKLDHLRSGELDLAFVRDVDQERTAGLRSADLWQDTLVAAVPLEHSASGDDPIDLARLGDLPLMLSSRDENPGFRATIQAILSRAGVEPPTGPRLTRAAEALAIIASGRAWTILIAATIASRPREVALRTIQDPAAVTTVSIAWRPSAQVAHREALIQTTLALRDRGSLTTDSPGTRGATS